jgi:C4-type Zn-finger protein
VASQEMPPEAEPSSTCPICGIEMVIIRITPILFGGEFEDLALACKKCGSAKTVRNQALLKIRSSSGNS